MACCAAKKKSCIVKAVIVALLVGVATGVIVWSTTREKSSAKSDAEVKGDELYSEDTLPDNKNADVEENIDLYSRTRILYEVPFENNPSTNYLEGFLHMYSKFLLSDPQSIIYSMSLNFAESTNIFDVDVSGRNDLCFTDNLYLLELNLKNGDDFHRKHPNNETLQQITIPTIEVNNFMITTSNHTMCIHNIDKLPSPYQLPNFFHPHNYGAAAIIRSTTGYNDTYSSVSTPSYSIVNLFYDRKYQRSMYPILTTDLISTSDVYFIEGIIGVEGDVKRKNTGSYDVVDEPVFKFKNIDISPQPPALFLYLTTRSAWMRFSEDDIFIYMEGDGNVNWPDGSFYEEGSYQMRWPAGARNTDIRDYLDGFWFLWCTTFTITLAGGPIEVVEEY